MDTITHFRKWKAQTETEMENIIDEIIKTGDLIASVSYGKPGDDCDRLWHIDTYDCDGYVFQIEYTDYMYIDLKMLGASQLEEECEEEKHEDNSAPMTNRKLIDYCNSHWGEVHLCCECPYSDNYCKQFQIGHCGDTPFMGDTRNGGEFYTDEEIEYEN